MKPHEVWKHMVCFVQSKYDAQYVDACVYVVYMSNIDVHSKDKKWIYDLHSCMCIYIYIYTYEYMWYKKHLSLSIYIYINRS